MKPILLSVLLAGCLDSPPITATDEQAICRDNPDTCPGGHPISPKNYTINQAKRAAAASGHPSTAIPVAACNALSCWATVNWNAYDFIRADCYDFGAVAWCDFKSCTGTVDGDMVDYQCHDLPPLE